MFIKTQDVNPPSEIRLPIRNEAGETQHVSLVKVGCSFQGWIYCVPDGGAFYRLLPIEEAPVQRRSDIDSWINKAIQVAGRRREPAAVNLAPITEADQREIGGSHYFWIRYGVKTSHSLVQALADRDPLVRLDYIIKVLWQIPVWWASLYEGFIPMPADIVFTADEQPYLLMLPFWRFPDVESVFSAPERGLYLAPEYVRGITSTGLGNHLDRYALGVLLLHCFYDIPRPSDGGSVLRHSANGSLWKDLNLVVDPWLQKLGSTGEVIRAIMRMVDVDLRARAAMEPDALANLLAYWRRRAEPATALRELMADGKYPQAYELAQGILISDDSYPVLLLAGRIAHLNGRSMEAIDYLEKAINKTNAPAQACKEQFDILTSLASRGTIEALVALNEPFGDKIDERVNRDFHLLSPQDQNEETEVAMADYLLWRGQNNLAVDFIYARLFDSGRNYLRQKYRLRMAYVKAMIRLFRPGAAQEEQRAISTDVQTAFNGGTLSSLEFRAYSEELAGLKEEINAIRGRPGGQA